MGAPVLEVDESLLLGVAETPEDLAGKLAVLLAKDDMLVLGARRERPGLDGASREFDDELLDTDSEDLGPRTDVRARLPLWNDALSVSALIEARTASRFRGGPGS